MNLYLLSNDLFMLLYFQSLCLNYKIADITIQKCHVGMRYFPFQLVAYIKCTIICQHNNWFRNDTFNMSLGYLMCMCVFCTFFNLKEKDTLDTLYKNNVLCVCENLCVHLEIFGFTLCCNWMHQWNEIWITNLPVINIFCETMFLIHCYK